MINLSQAEREKIIMYLAQEVTTDKGMLEQMEKISSPEAVIKMYQRRIAAYSIVAIELKKIEEMSI